MDHQPQRYTLGTASKATGKTKTTIQRAITKGLLPAEKTSRGGYSIAADDLHRVFPAIKTETQAETADVTPVIPQDEQAYMRFIIDTLEKNLARERAAYEALLKDRDAWKSQATELLQLNRKPKSRWWPF